MNDRVQRLEEKIAYLERHVIEQDKVMLEMGDQLAKLRKELHALRERGAAATGGSGEADAASERPPHY